MPEQPGKDWISELTADLPPLITTDEAAKLLRTTRRNIYRQIELGRLHSVQQAHGGSSRHLIPRTAVGQYLRSLEGGKAA